jgi:hypothetical protein
VWRASGQHTRPQLRAVTVAGLDLFSTRIDSTTSDAFPTIYRTSRVDANSALAILELVSSASGIAVEPLLSADGRLLYFHKLVNGPFAIHLLQQSPPRDCAMICSCSRPASSEASLSNTDRRSYLRSPHRSTCTRLLPAADWWEMADSRDPTGARLRRLNPGCAILVQRTIRMASRRDAFSLICCHFWLFCRLKDDPFLKLVRLASKN